MSIPPVPELLTVQFGVDLTGYDKSVLPPPTIAVVDEDPLEGGVGPVWAPEGVAGVLGGWRWRVMGLCGVCWCGMRWGR